MFHSERLVGAEREIPTGRNSWRTKGEKSLEIRWYSKIGFAVTKVPGLIYGENLVVMEKLTREQAKAWLCSFPRPETRDKEYLEYIEKKAEWDEKVKKGVIYNLDPFTQG